MANTLGSSGFALSPSLRSDGILEPCGSTLSVTRRNDPAFLYTLCKGLSCDRVLTRLIHGLGLANWDAAGRATYGVEHHCWWYVHILPRMVENVRVIGVIVAVGFG